MFSAYAIGICMARALFLSVPLHGHVRPTRDVVSALVRRGHTVRYFAGAALDDVIAAMGAEPSAYRSADVGRLPALTQELPRLPLSMMELSASVLANDLDEFRRWAPDYVIADLLAPWGYWVAGLLDVPLVVSVPIFALDRRVALDAMNAGARPASVRSTLTKVGALWTARTLHRRLVRRYGVRGAHISATAFPHAGLQVVYTTRTLQPHNERFASPGWTFAGPPIPTLPRSSASPAGAYLSLGTVFQGDGVLLSTCASAIADETGHVVLSTGGKELPQALSGDTRVHVTRFADQNAELERAALFVTHAGLGGVQESLLAGTPMVLLPQMPEQLLVASRIESLGAGIMLRSGQITPETLRSAVRRVLSEPSYRAAAERLGATIRSESSAEAGVNAIERFVAQS